MLLHNHKSLIPLFKEIKTEAFASIARKSIATRKWLLERRDSYSFWSNWIASSIVLKRTLPLCWPFNTPTTSSIAWLLLVSVILVRLGSGSWSGTPRVRIREGIGIDIFEFKDITSEDREKAPVADEIVKSVVSSS